MPGARSTIRSAISSVGSPSGARALGPAQDAQHVVLLERDALRLDHARQEAADHVDRAQQVEHFGGGGLARDGGGTPGNIVSDPLTGQVKG